MKGEPTARRGNDENRGPLSDDCRMRLPSDHAPVIVDFEV